MPCHSHSALIHVGRYTDIPLYSLSVKLKSQSIQSITLHYITLGIYWARIHLDHGAIKNKITIIDVIYDAALLWPLVVFVFDGSY